MHGHTAFAKASGVVAALWCIGFHPASAEAQYEVAYSEDEAVKYADVATATYCSASTLKGLDCGRPCHKMSTDAASMRLVEDVDTETRALILRNKDGQCTLAFRGTANPTNWEENAATTLLHRIEWCSDSGTKCGVGSGIFKMFEAVRDDIVDGLAAVGCNGSSPLVMTGHSLGGALVELAMMNLSSSFNLTATYTFGQPRVGDRHFAQAFYKRVGHVPFYRVTRYDDPVVYLPSDALLRYHVGTEIYYRPSGAVQVCEPPALDDAENHFGINNTCAGQSEKKHVSMLIGTCAQTWFPGACGHYKYMDQKTKDLMQGSACSSGTFMV